MVARFQDYLAAQVLNEGNIINYRLLSRALKVHGNTAKEALYDFHRTQNARRAGSLHATYLLIGTRKPDNNAATNGSFSHDGNESFMADSSFMSSSMPEHEEEEIEETAVTWVALAREEDLEAVKKTYEAITAIHVYSLGPGPLQNLQVVSDCNRKVYSEHLSGDPLETWKDYGTIHNPKSKRRTARRPPLPQQGTTVPITAAMKPKQSVATTKAPEVKVVDSKAEPTKSEPKKEETSSTPKGKPKVPALKKESSSLFRSFARTRELKKEQSVSDASVAASPITSGPASPAEDEIMKDDSEDEQLLPTPDATNVKEKSDANRKARLEREDQLRKMMEDEENDEPMPDHDVTPPEELDPPDEPAPEPEPESEPQVTVSGGRRRGKRRVMKKKTFKDADGYLVTKEEAAWESFSEEEPQPKKTKTTAPAAKTTATKDKKAVKPGQGNIMSFFAKK